ncbi:MAG: hypothetical protein CMI02_20130 [Oceanospirillaceae bacterium]|mgnify:CR=1 FL=1|nr:hypothetical protein [Oceanospirillaceae bacterium]MBT14338.1 hypothetical protein [Oceanospirillaceae bacterium]|tara:strand:- start:102731 stop:103372 length:642 start_codon:yes stop_codon:yes gene_type:complete
MANTFGNSYGLTTLCPIINGRHNNTALDKITRRRIQLLKENSASPFARIPNTYFARLFILNDVFFEQGNDVARDHLKSKYLVFTSNFHGDLDTYLSGMWQHAEAEIRHIWQHAVAFNNVQNEKDFIAYIKKCQLTTSLFFNGSTDDTLQDQLKSLYIKQAFTEFALTHQGKTAAQLRAAFNQFIRQVDIHNPVSPAWSPGQETLSDLNPLQQR